MEKSAHPLEQWNCDNTFKKHIFVASMVNFSVRPTY